MATSLPRSLPWRSLIRSQGIRTGCSTVRRQSTATSSSSLPPESPRYVDIPQPPQPQGADPPIIKGVLPRPRQILRRDGPDKSSREYLDSVSPARRTKRAIPLPRDEAIVRHKARMTDMRRRNLREGLQQLKSRKVKMDRFLQARSDRKTAEYREAISRPEREDDRLTSPTVLEIKQQAMGTTMSPEQLTAKRMRMEAKEAAKAEERRTHLHTLYMNARDFIVTEDALNKKVEEVFAEGNFRNENDPSIWNQEGVPERIIDIVNRAQGRSNKALEANEGYTRITRERLQRIAEELTGGKMEDPNRHQGEMRN